jgi:ribosomal protein S11
MQDVDVRYMLSRALANTLGDMVFDKQRDGDTPAAYQRAMLFGSALDLLRSLKEMVAAFENVPGEAAQTALEKARQVIALAEPDEDASSLLN